MSNQPDEIGRGLFGYRRSSVNQAISDRDIMLRQSENRAREAEAKAVEMEERMNALQQQITEQQLRLADRERELSEQMTDVNRHLAEMSEALEAREHDMADRDRHIVELRAHIDRLVQQQLEAPPRPDAPPQNVVVSEEVGRLLKAAEESADRIVEQARRSTERNTAEAERQWRELQTSLSRYAGWRERIDPQLTDLQARMQELHSRITEIPDRVRAAFAPLAEASAATEAGLQALSGDMTPPLLSAPSRSDHLPESAEDEDIAGGVAGTGDEPHSSAR